MNRRGSPKEELKPPSHSGTKRLLRRCQTWSYIPEASKGQQNPQLMACVQQTDEVRNDVRGMMAHPVNPESDSQPQALQGLRFDKQGMSPPHCSLGSLGDFRSYLKAKGETDDISKPEVIGSDKPFTFFILCRSPTMEKEAEDNEDKEMENDNSPIKDDDVQSDVLQIPALRFGGHLATWTGNSTSNQGEVGISGTIVFKIMAGEMASSHLELRNEGSTVIFMSWQKILLPQGFPNLQSQTKKPHFYFSSFPGVIYPGETQQVEFIFKSQEPGIKGELWQLNTHPLLLQGASLQVRLRGVALNKDKTADQRLFIEKTLEKKVSEKMCQSIVYELLQGVRTPERPSSPAELYIAEEQQFLSKNTELHYHHQPVQNLKKLWQQVSQGQPWDLSVDTLRKAVLSLPDEDSTQDSPTREEIPNQLNSLYLQLCKSYEPRHRQLTATAIGKQLLRKMLDTMDGEATELKELLGLPETNTWTDKHGKSAEERKQMEKSGDRTGKTSRENRRKESGLPVSSSSESINQQPPEEQNVDMKVKLMYSRLLHVKVKALMEDLLDNLFDVMDELNAGAERAHTQATY